MTRYIRILLISGLIFAFITRIILPAQFVFVNGTINFNTVDAYFMVRQANIFPYWQQIDMLREFPNGVASFNYQVFPLLIVILGKILAISNELAGAILPPALFFLTLIPVYMTAKELYGNNIAVGSIFILCLLPGEILHRTSLGAADYHCWEILLVSIIFCMAILAIKRKDIFYAAFSALFFAIYWFSWQGALIVPFIMGIALLVYCSAKKPILLLMFIIILIGIEVIFSPTIFDIMIGMLTSLTTSSISETQSLFFTNKQLDLTTQIAYFGIGLYFVLFGIGWIGYRILKYKNTAEILFFAWSIVMLLLMISMRRFDYYFAVNAAIILAFIACKLVDVFSLLFNKKAIAIVLFIILCLPIARQSIILPLTSDTYISNNWQNVCQWLKTDKQQDYAILTHQDYGYYLEGISNQSTFSDPGSNLCCYNIFHMTDYKKAQQQCINIKAKYIVIDGMMLTSKLSSIIKNTDIQLENTFMFYLYNNKEPVYQSNDVKIYQMY